MQTVQKENFCVFFFLSNIVITLPMTIVYIYILHICIFLNYVFLSNFQLREEFGYDINPHDPAFADKIAAKEKEIAKRAKDEKKQKNKGMAFYRFFFSEFKTFFLF